MNGRPRPGVAGDLHGLVPVLVGPVVRASTRIVHKGIHIPGGGRGRPVLITFTCFDETNLGFLSNIFSDRHKKLIPNLPHLQAVVFGKSLRSEQPVVIQIPFDPEKIKG